MEIDEQWECWTLCMRDKKMKARTGGEKGTYTPVTTACPEVWWGQNLRQVWLESKSDDRKWRKYTSIWQPRHHFELHFPTELPTPINSLGCARFAWYSPWCLLLFTQFIRICSGILFLLPSDNVQHDLQHGSLITFPKEESLRNKRKPMHQVYLR